MLKYLVIFALMFVENGSPRPTPNATGFGKPQGVSKTSQSAAKNQNQQAQIAMAIEPSLSEQADGKPQTNKGTTPNDPDKPWSLSDKIAVGACIAGFSQFLALIVTIWIIIRNGRHQLRAYVLVERGIIANVANPLSEFGQKQETNARIIAPARRSNRANNHQKYWPNTRLRSRALGIDLDTRVSAQISVVRNAESSKSVPVCSWSIRRRG
jgi:hypothetical protein